MDLPEWRAVHPYRIISCSVRQILFFFCCWHFSFFSSKTIGYFTILPMTNNWQLCPFRELSNDTANFFWIDIAHIICFALQSFSLAFYYLHDIDNTGRLQQIQSGQSIEFLSLCLHLFISFFFIFIHHTYLTRIFRVCVSTNILNENKTNIGFGRDERKKNCHVQ